MHALPYAFSNKVCLEGRDDFTPDVDNDYLVSILQDDLDSGLLKSLPPLLSSVMFIKSSCASPNMPYNISRCLGDTSIGSDLSSHILKLVMLYQAFHFKSQKNTTPYLHTFSNIFEKI